MCKCDCGCCEELTKEELIEEAIDNVNEGACAGCTLSDLFDEAYNRGRKDTLDFYRVITEDLLCGELEEE